MTAVASIRCLSACVAAGRQSQLAVVSLLFWLFVYSLVSRQEPFRRISIHHVCLQKAELQRIQEERAAQEPVRNAALLQTCAWRSTFHSL